ncbi:MAG: hypothetical protein R3199_07440 [Gemmatimonadota bacterium]|nr:hypothetical protein [Gemmatimonadota bacterium]
MRIRDALVATPLFLVLATAPLRGQSFDVPSFQTPFPETGLGLLAFYPDADHAGAALLWRQAGERSTIGVRAGVQDFGGEIGYLAGVDYNSHGRPDGGDGFEGALVSGLGVGWAPDADVVRARLPLGFVWGWRHPADGLAIVPYFGPRALLDVTFREETVAGSEEWDEDVDLHLNFELGFDVELARSVKLRFGATLGHEDVVGAGVSLGSF